MSQPTVVGADAFLSHCSNGTVCVGWGAVRLRVNDVENLPREEPALILLRTGALAVVKALGRRKGQRLLRAWAADLANDGAVTALHPSRTSKERAEDATAHAQAEAWLRANMAAFIAAMPPE